MNGIQHPNRERNGGRIAPCPPSAATGGFIANAAASRREARTLREDRRPADAERAALDDGWLEWLDGAEGFTR